MTKTRECPKRPSLKAFREMVGDDIVRMYEVYLDCKTFEGEVPMTFERFEGLAFNGYLDGMGVSQRFYQPESGLCDGSRNSKKRRKGYVKLVC